MSLSKAKRSLKGFALLEVLLAVIIIAAFAAAVVMLYNKVSGNTALAGEEQAVQQIFSAYGQYVGTNYAAATSSDLIDADLVPSNIVNGDDFVGPYGKINLTGDTSNYQVVSVSAHNIPADVAIKFCSDMVSSYDVSKGAASSASITTASECSDEDWGSSSIITFYSPKDMSAS